jgi:hypothetical protein
MRTTALLVVLVGLLGMSRPAAAQEAPAEPAPASNDVPGPDDTAAFHDQLAAAKLAINRGENPLARAILESLADRLENGETPPASIAREALVYLGDLRYIAGEQSGAREAFRMVLLDAPEHVISPYHHTEDVRAFFALIRDQVEAEIALRPAPVPVPVPPPTRVPAMPVWGYAPLGIPQLASGRTARGILYGSSQIALAATSIGTFILVDRANRSPDGHPFNWTEAEVQRRVPVLRYGVQWPATTLVYSIWLFSVIDAAISWSRDHPRTAPPSARRGRSGTQWVGYTARPRRGIRARLLVGPTGVWMAGEF